MNPLIEEFRKRILDKSSKGHELFCTDPTTHTVYSTMESLDEGESGALTVEEYVITVLLQLLEERKEISDSVLAILTKPSPIRYFTNDTARAIESIDILRAKTEKKT